MSDRWGSSEVPRRLPVWHALSDLFLDTELQPHDYERIATCLSKSGYSADELHRILLEEVTPAFDFNMFEIAGEWSSWTEEAVLEIMSTSKPDSRPKRWIRERLYKGYVKGEWGKIEPFLEGRLSASDQSTT